MVVIFFLVSLIAILALIIILIKYRSLYGGDKLFKNLYGETKITIPEYIGGIRLLREVDKEHYDIIRHIAEVTDEFEGYVSNSSDYKKQETTVIETVVRKADLLKANAIININMISTVIDKIGGTKRVRISCTGSAIELQRKKYQ